MNQPNRASSKYILLWVVLAVFLASSAAVTVIGILVVKFWGVAGSRPLLVAGEGMTPVDLTAFYDKSGSWDRGNEFQEVPRGPVVLAGVPFEVNGLLRLSGRSAKNDNKPYRDEVKDIPVGKKFARLHLLHIISFSTSREEPYARVALRYADGSSASFPLIYGTHGRDWHRPKYEFPSALLDPNTKVVWRGEYDSTPINGKTLRIFKTMFVNPKPDIEVATIDVFSENASPNATIMAMSIGPAHLPRPKDDAPGSPEPEAPYEGEIRITAVDAESGEALANVQLKVSGSEAGGSFRTPDVVTDAKGEAIVPHPGKATRSLTLLASGDGVAMKTTRWNASADVALPVEHTLRLEKGVAIGGLVRDEEGRPIANAKISLRPLGRPTDSGFRESLPFTETSLTTDAQGRWEFRSLPRNLSQLSASVSHADFVDKRFLSDGVDRAYAGERIKFATLLDKSARFELRKGLVVTGRVSNEAGEPIGGAKLLLADNRYANNPITGRTDDTGAFKLVGAKVGQTFLTVQANGYAPHIAPLTVDEKLKPIDLKLAPGHTLKIRVVDEFDTPVRSARVSIDMWQNRQTIDLSGSTDSRGHVTLDSAPGSGMSGSIYKSGYRSINGLQFTPGENEQTFTLRRSLTISGEVLDAETKQPIERFDVVRGHGQAYDREMYWEDYNLVRGSNGIFSLRLDQQSITALKIESDEHLPSIISLGTNGETHFTIELKKGSGPKGIVLQPDGQPAAKAELAVLTPGRSLNIGFRRMSGGRGDGTYAEANDKGAFSLRAQAEGEKIIVLHASGYAETPYSNFVSGGSIRLEPWGVIEGLVIVAGQPGTNQSVMLTPGHMTGRNSYWYDFANYRVITDDAGKFVISNAPPGERRVVRLIQTEPNSWMHSQPTDVTVKPGEVTRMQIGGDGHLVIGQLALSDPSVTLNWRTAGRHHLNSFPKPPPFKSQEEYRAWAQRPETIEAQKKARSYTVQVDDSGAFRIEEVLPGNYDLMLSFQEPDANGRPFGRQIASLTTNIVVPPLVKGATMPLPIDLGQIVVPVRQENRPPPVAPTARRAAAEPR